ncbi:MAG: heavy metal translocating P-type ATPase [Enterobacterales bacterium]|nr:heavy metal translocating P-type ATPase [Enterobacterales bacterium]
MSSNCFHCGLANQLGHQFQCDLLGKTEDFCCAGCLAIAETLVCNGLTDFYRFRDANSQKPTELIPQEIRDIEALDTPEILADISQCYNEEYSSNTETSNASTHWRSIDLGIEGISCSACGWLIEKHLSKLPQVKEISVNVSSQRAQLVWSADYPLSKLIKSLAKMGYKMYPFSPDNREKIFAESNRNYIKRLLVAAFGMMQVMTYSLIIYIGEFDDLSVTHRYFFYGLSALVTTPIVFYSAVPFFRSAYLNLKAKRLGMNFPVSVAILSAYFASLYSLFYGANAFYFDSVVMFTFFLLIGRYLEHRARYHSLIKHQNFQQLLPLSVTKQQNGNNEIIRLSEVKPGDCLIIFAGAIIPCDGKLLDESAEINEAILTGEFIPLVKRQGDNLISGSTNNSASFKMRVAKEVKNSRIYQLIALQQEAEKIKPKAVNLADQFSHWYISLLLALVVITGLYWWQIDPQMIFSVVLSMLVITCPCALSLATPASFTAAAAELSDLGLMLRSPDALANLAKVDHIYFDKTGTLTQGQMTLTNIQVFSDLSAQNCLQIAASLEQISDHPIAIAIKQKAIQKRVVVNHKETIAAGVEGEIDQIAYRLGRRDYVEQYGATINPCEYQPFETPLYLMANGQHIATFLLEDEIKNDAAHLIQDLKTKGYQCFILSGDEKSLVEYTAKALSIDHYYAALTPKDKLSLVVQAQQAGHKILMVGDGLNDLGALAAANVSITMANGTNVSKTASDAVLVTQDLKVISDSLQLSKKMRRIIKQNLIWAVTYNLIAVPFAMMGLVPAWLAALGMSFSSLIVVLNALRLRY